MSIKFGRYKDVDKNIYNRKGWRWEMKVADAVASVPYVEYEGNSSDFKEWLRTQNRNSFDGVVLLPNGKKIRLEMKYRDFPVVYHNWFMDCWFPRKADIFITNNPSVISYSDKRVLDVLHRKLMSLSEFIVYLSKLVRKMLCVPSMYICDVCARIVFSSYFIGAFDKVSSGITRFDWYRRLKVFNGIESFWFMGGFGS